MLNGIAPVIIFNFPITTATTIGELSGVPKLVDFLSTNVGIPIPIYLDERLTGIYIESESKALDIDTSVEAKLDATSPDVTQRGLNNVVTVNMIAKRDNIVLAALLAMNDLIFTRVVAQSYGITYLNGPTVVFGGLLDSFTTNTGTDDDLMRISMQISKSNQKSTKDATKILNIKKVIGDFPTVTSSSVVGVA